MPDNSRPLAKPDEGCDSSVRKKTLDTKRLGEMAEMAFVLKATSLGLTPSRPYGERRPYDFLLECGSRVLRIQVKSVYYCRPQNPRAFTLNVCQHKERGRAPYTADDIDFITAYVAPHDTWYVIPVDVLR